MVFADVSVTQAMLDEYYSLSSKYADTTLSTGAGESSWDKSRLEAAAARISNALEGATERTILDIGCATGGLLAAMARLGYHNLSGVDPSQACAEASAASSGATTWVGSLTELGSTGLWDCIVLSHTLEHVVGVKNAMVEICRRITPGGLLYIETPDARRYADYLTTPYQEFNTEHINHFSGTCLENVLRLSGFAEILSDVGELQSSATSTYPIVYAFGRRASGPRQPIQRDLTLVNEVERYISASELMMTVMRRRLEKFVLLGSLIVWGTGQLTMKLLADTVLRNADILAFVDANPVNWGKALLGRQVQPPENIVGSTVPILIASTLHEATIRQQIGEMGLNNPILSLL